MVRPVPPSTLVRGVSRVDCLLPRSGLLVRPRRPRRLVVVVLPVVVEVPVPMAMAMAMAMAMVVAMAMVMVVEMEMAATCVEAACRARPGQRQTT